MLENTKQVAAPGELCNANIDGKSGQSFFEFRAAYIAERPKLATPTPKHQSQLLSRYFDFLRDKFKRRKTIVCDIKYSHIHNFNSSWWDIYSPPFLIRYAAQENIPIIHLVRNKIYQTAFSDFYAGLTGVWRTQSADKIVIQQTEVNLTALKNKADRITKGIELVNQWLRKTRHIDVTYEQITGVDALATLNRVLRFLDLDEAHQLKTDFVKTTPPYEQIISNFAEVEEYLSIDLQLDR